MCELGTGPVQGLLGAPGFGHVLDGANEERPACDSLDQAGEGAHVLHRSAPGDDPEGEIEIRSTERLREPGVERGQVVGMDDVTNSLYPDLDGGIELEDAVELLGPHVLVHRDIGSEVARVAQSLSV